LEDYAFQTQQSQIAVVTAALEEYLHRVMTMDEQAQTPDDPTDPE